MLTTRFAARHRPGWSLLRRRSAWVALAFVLAAAVAAGCYNSSTGAANIGDSINFKLPAFPKTGSNAVQIFTEMHYQPSYRTQETPRLLPPPDSVPITGRELRYASLEEYAELTVPDRVTESYDPGNGSALFAINCTVCHGTGLKGDGPIVTFMKRGPFPADLTIDFTRDATDGELFGFISAGGRQGQTLRLRGRRPDSPMPEFQNLLTEDERWTLVLYLRSQIGR